MSSDHWQKVKQTLADISSLEGVARRNYFKHLKRTSPKLANEVRELLAASSAAEDDSFLDRPVVPLDMLNRDDADESPKHD